MSSLNENNADLGANRGRFVAGDRVQLTDQKGKIYSLTITPGKEWHTHKGWIVHDDLIKRVIALPNETVTIKSCVVFIDGRELQEPYLEQDQLLNPDASERCGSHTDLAPVLVPEDHVFVMGDNRQQSFDSRDFGAIEESKVRGRAFVVLWPFGAWAWL